MKALTQGSARHRLCCAHAVDMAHAGARGGSPPLAGAFEPADADRQVLPTDGRRRRRLDGHSGHGGMGFIEETGPRAISGDARIAPIYEGTKRIQAIDLVTRKLTLSDGAQVRGFIAELREVRRCRCRVEQGRFRRDSRTARCGGCGSRRGDRLAAFEASRRKACRGARRRDRLSSACSASC